MGSRNEMQEYVEFDIDFNDGYLKRVKGSIKVSKRLIDEHCGIHAFIPVSKV